MAESLKLTSESVSKKKVGKDDFACIAEAIVDEQRKRERSEDRKSLEKKMKEIDRQVSMTPASSGKRNADGSGGQSWTSELELPNQRQALEMNNADARRLLWPDSGSWFEANAEMTDKYLSEVEDLALIAGDENETRSSVNQEIVNELVEAWMLNQHKAYNFRKNMDVINAESFKYGVGIGRAKIVKTPFFSTEIEIPQLVPCSLKNTYLNNNKYNLLHEGLNIDAGIIRKVFIRWEDLKIAASKGGNDPDDMNGGWIPANLKGLEPDDDKSLELIEFEGDLVVAKTSESLYLPRVIVTVACGGKDGDTKSNVVRLRFRKSARSSYFLFPYHEEDMNTPYAVGPLIMAHPIQAAGTMALNKAMDAACLSTDPFLFYDADDPEMAANGGPVIYPGGSCPKTGDVQEFAPGEASALFQVYIGLMNQYAELTGMTGARLGAQTTSHTTAFAKGQEVNRGQIRIVDYVKSVMQGPLAEWLQYAYEQSRELLGDKNVSIYMHKSRSFVNLSKDALPQNVFFDIFGASGPSEDAAKVGAQVQAMQMAIGLETAKRQLGEGDPMNLTALQKEFLRKGGLIDVDKFYEAGQPNIPQGVAGASPMDGANGGSIENAVPAALQAVLAGRGGV